MYICDTKVDWNAFNYIHSTNARDAFQRLTEQLFCFEFKQPYGIYRYYNQPYIEAMPIRDGDEYIGFQSKYYDASTRLSDRVGELKEAIDGASQKYPDLTQIVFYTNKEPGISTKKGETKPTYIQTIETYAAKRNIRIDWRGLSQIETILINPANAYLRDYFFATDGGIRKILEQIKSHTSTIFNSLESKLNYHGQTIKITHNLPVMDSILNSDKNITIVHGDGGCGKSGLIKDLLSHEQTFPVWLFKATDFNCPSIPEFVRKYGDCPWEDLLSAFDGAPCKLCIIDSAEKAFTIVHQDTLNQAIQSLLAHGWKLLITIRSSYLANFINLILRTSAVNEIQVPALSEQALAELEQAYTFSLPANEKLRDLLRNLFYLNMYLSKDKVCESQTIAEFFESIWHQVICRSSVQTNLIHTRRGNLILKIARIVASRDSCYYLPDDTTDWEALSALCESDILQSDDTMGGYFITHDVYEELIWNRILSQEFSRKGNSVTFFSSIGDSLLVRKNFRIWLHHHFEAFSREIEQFLSDVLQNDDIAPVWKDDILIALMSENNEVFTNRLDNIILKENYKLLVRTMHLLNTACKVIDDDLCQKLFTADERKTNVIYRYVKPSGIGWHYLISFCYSHRENIPWSSIAISLASEILYAWTSHNFNGATTREAGLLALFLYPKITGPDRKFHMEEMQITKVCDAILFSAHEIHSELSEILENVIAHKQIRHRELYYHLCSHLLENAFNTGKLCETDPDLVIRLAKCFWVDTEKGTGKYGHGTDHGVYFGLREHTDHSYYPSSAFQTPILPLLNAAPYKAIDFVLELFDAASTAYQNSRLNSDYNECSEIEIMLPDGNIVKQIASSRLWLMHRGTSASSHLLDSMLMALERWLYQAFSVVSAKAANNLCMKLLSESHSAAITSVVTSMVIAYPEKLFDTACVLIQTKEILSLDINRRSNERSANFCRGLSPHKKMYDDERISSNALDFRKKSIEEIILTYQINTCNLSDEEQEARMERLYAAFDHSYSPEEDLPDYARFALYRMDLRKAKLVRGISAEGHDQIAIIPDLPDNLLQKQQQVRESTQDDERFAGLQLWSTAHLEHNAEWYNQYPQYENNPQSALSEGLGFVEKPCFIQLDNRFIIHVAAALLIDFKDQLDSESLDICRNIILSHVQNVIAEQAVRSIGDGTDAAIAALPTIINESVDCSLREDPAVLLLMLICDWGSQRDYAIKCFRENIWQQEDLGHKIISLFIQLKPSYDEEVSKCRGISPFEFFEKHTALIKNTFAQKPLPLPECTALSSCALITLNLLLPVKMDNVACSILEQAGTHLWPKLFKNSWQYEDREDWPEKYEQIDAYIGWLANVLLQLDVASQNNILSLLIPYLTGDDRLNDLLTKLITTEDSVMMVSSFWNIWNQLFTAIEALCNKEKDSILRICNANLGPHYSRRSDEVVSTYLLAFPWWQEKIREWHTLRQEDSGFFTLAVNKIGYHPAVLYSIARVLNSIGYAYTDLGIRWLSTLIANNAHLSNCNLPVNTQYYIEEYVQHFCSKNRNKLKADAEIRNALITVLSFLVDRGSTCGYMLREQYC